MRRRPLAVVLALLLPAVAAAQEQPPRPAPPARAGAQQQQPRPGPVAVQPPRQQQQPGPRSLLDRRAATPAPPTTAMPRATPASPRPPQQVAVPPRPAASPATPVVALPVIPPPRLAASPPSVAVRAVVPPPRPAAAPQQQQQRPAPIPAALPVVPPLPPTAGQAPPGGRPKPVPRIGDHLHQTRWRVETIQGRAVVRSAAPTLEFLRDDHLRGGTGCNRFVGPWHTRASRAVMGPLRKSRLTCRPDLAQQEQQFLDTLERTERFELKDEGRTLLVYSSLSTAPSRFTRLP